jgi:hypothetical protein
MLDPERRQDGESQEDYVKRISKFPTLKTSTIMNVVFPTYNEDSLRIFKDWAKTNFSESFLPTFDCENNIILLQTGCYPPLVVKSISTKAFAKWVEEENIFEAWIVLGEKVSPRAKLFIEFVNGKAVDSKQVSTKVKRKKPNPNTGNGKMEYFKTEIFIPLVEKVVKKNPKWQNSQVLAHSKVKDALAMSGLPKGTPSVDTKKKWICTARKNAGVKAKTGRPTKQTSSLNTP